MIRTPTGPWAAAAAFTTLLALPAFGPALRAGDPPAPANFIRRDGNVLKDGDREFRFISFNIPNLHYVEDDMRFDRTMPFRLPDDFEIDDALGAIAQIGGGVVRTYTLSVRKADDPPGMPRTILGPGKLDEGALVALDRVAAAAARHRVRLIIPFVDQWSWFGGTAELAAFRGKKAGDVWTDSVLIEDWKAIIAHVVGRTNTVTGVPYRDDPWILAWETGNELASPPAWTRTIAAHIKSLDPRHLVIDGVHRSTLLEESIEDPNVDLVGTHHYERDVREMLENIRKSARMARGRKPYHLGEFGFLSTEALRAVMDAVIDEGMAGALLWSLRYRSRDGGFYWHHEPAGGDRFKAYHWPGFPSGNAYDERRLMGIIREKAYEIQGIPAPPLPPPAAPRLLEVTPGGLVTWQGSAGAWCYDVERAEAAGGPWAVAGAGVSNADVQYRPLFCDESARPGMSYFYRVIARSPSGPSAPSNMVGPIGIAHRTLVDELRNDSRMVLREGKTAFAENEARKFKEDCHRLAGGPGSAIIYRGRGGIRALRVFAFTPKGEEAIAISFSADGRKFEAAETSVAPTATYGEEAYGFWKAMRTSSAPGGKPGFVRIEFRSEAQISRIEIDHDAVD